MVLDLCQEAPACPQHLVDLATLIFGVHPKKSPKMLFQHLDCISILQTWTDMDIKTTQIIFFVLHALYFSLSTV